MINTATKVTKNQLQLIYPHDSEIVPVVNLTLDSVGTRQIRLLKYGLIFIQSHRQLATLRPNPFENRQLSRSLEAQG